MGDWGVKLEALRLLVALATGCRRVLRPHLAGVLAAACALLTSCWPAFQHVVLDGAEELDAGVRVCGCMVVAASSCSPAIAFKQSPAITFKHLLQPLC